MSTRSFLALMQEITALYRQLLALSRDKHAAILERTVDTLDAIVRAEQAILLKLGQLETKRTAAVDLFAKDNNLPAADVSLLSWAERADADAADAIRAVHRNFGGILRELAETNARNREALESKMDYVNLALSVFSEKQDAGLYGGEDSAPVGINIFDSVV